MAFKHRDIIGKSIIEDHAIVLIHFFYPDADLIFDFSKKIEFWDTELRDLDPDIENFNDSVIADKLVKVHLLSGLIAWILFNIEIQGYKESGFAERVFRHFYRLLDKFGQRIAIITIYTDPDTDFDPGSFNYSLLGTHLSFNFKTYKVINQSEAELLSHPNPVALILLGLKYVAQAERKKDKESLLLNRGAALCKTILERDIDEKLKANLLKTIQLYFNFKVPEIRDKFDGIIKSFTSKTKPMSIFELDKMIAIEEATERVTERVTEQVREQDAITFVTNLLTGTDFPDEKIASLAQVSLEFILQVRNGVADI